MARYVAKLPERRRDPRRLRGRPQPALRLAARADPARRPHASSASGGSASASTYAKLTAKDRHKRPQDARARHSATAPRSPRSTAPASARSRRACRRQRCAAATCTASSEVIARLDIDAAHVIWGHSHRSGPWPRTTTANGRRRPARASSTPARGSTSRTSSRPEPNGSPYWPGTAVIVDDDGPPRLVRLLGERGHDELRPPTARREAGGVHGHALADLELDSSPSVWTACSISGKHPGSRTSNGQPLTQQHARALDDGPHAARLVRARVGARLILGLRRRSARPAPPPGAPAPPLARDAQQRLDLELGLDVRALAVVQRVQRRVSDPTGSAPASPGCRRCPRSRARSRSRTGHGISSRSTARRTFSSSRAGRNPPVCT